MLLREILRTLTRMTSTARSAGMKLRISISNPRIL